MLPVDLPFPIAGGGRWPDVIVSRFPPRIEKIVQQCVITIDKRVLRPWFIHRNSACLNGHHELANDIRWNCICLVEIQLNHMVTNSPKVRAEQ